MRSRRTTRCSSRSTSSRASRAAAISTTCARRPRCSRSHPIPSRRPHVCARRSSMPSPSRRPRRPGRVARDSPSCAAPFAGTLAGAAIALVIGIALHARLNDARSSRDAQAAIVASLLTPGSQVAAALRQRAGRRGAERQQRQARARRPAEAELGPHLRGVADRQRPEAAPRGHVHGRQRGRRAASRAMRRGRRPLRSRSSATAARRRRRRLRSRARSSPERRALEARLVEHGHERQAAVALGVVEPVADHEAVRDLEADVPAGEVDLAP